jgi:hypothetical protein
MSTLPPPERYKVQRLVFVTPDGEAAWMDVSPWRASGELTLVSSPGTYRLVLTGDGTECCGEPLDVDAKTPRLYDYGRSILWKWWIYPSWVGRTVEGASE